MRPGGAPELFDFQPMNLISTITCPHCGFRKEERMPENACTFFYECTGCRSLLRPLSGDCCVFCSYGDVVCPPKQHGGGCCTQRDGMSSWEETTGEK
jgi:hypothetical protein